MPGISPKVPLMISNTDGAYELNKNYAESAKQNLKNLVLTSPGEKLTDPNFGVGVREYLFENSTTNSGDDVIGDIAGRINSQVSTYMRYLNIKSITSTSNEPNVVSFRIDYELVNFNIDDFLLVEFE